MRSLASRLLRGLTPLLALLLLTACGSTGGASSVTDSGQPDLIPTETAPSGDAQVGQIVQMRVAAKYRWSLVEPTASLATQIDGDYGEHVGVCFWYLQGRLAWKRQRHI